MSDQDPVISVRTARRGALGDGQMAQLRPRLTVENRGRLFLAHVVLIFRFLARVTCEF